MLIELRVENLLLIEQAQLRLAPGLNVLTGETGAGKTVLAHALDLLLGGRARAGIVRPGAAEAYVEGVFELPTSLPEGFAERLPADAEEIVLARRVAADGRTRAYLNGRTATVGELRDLGAALMSFYGQHEHRKLTISSKQLQLLDERCGPEQTLRLRACAEAFAETRRLQERLGELRGLSGERERELDLLEFELAEIDSAAPDQQEYDELLARRERVRRADVPAELLTTVFVMDSHRQLEGSVPLARLVRAEPAESLFELAGPGGPTLRADADFEEVARLMADFNLTAAAVVDDAGQMIGVITVDDVLEVMLPKGWRRRFGLLGDE